MDTHQPQEQDDVPYICRLLCATVQYQNIELGNNGIKGRFVENGVRKWAFGSHSSCDCVLANVDYISSCHFELRFSTNDKSLRIRDTSDRGFYLNESRLVKGLDCILKHGDKIYIPKPFSNHNVCFVVLFSYELYPPQPTMGLRNRRSRKQTTYENKLCVKHVPIRTHDRIDPRVDQRLHREYLYRQMLQISGAQYSHGPQLSVMTYNVLYPGIAKNIWVNKYMQHLKRLRETVLLAEIGRYNPDVICLQEVPMGDDLRWWEKQLFSLGYELTFAYVNEKDHGIGICFKYDLFTEICHDFSNFDKPEPEIMASKSNRAMLFLCLGFKEKFLRIHRAPSRQGIIVGVTHLALKIDQPLVNIDQIWRMLLHADAFASHVRSKSSPNHRFYTFLAGDFNTRILDPDFSPSCPSALEQEYEALNRKKSYADYLVECRETQQLQERVGKNMASLYSLAYDLVEPRIVDKNRWCFIDYIFAVCDYNKERSLAVSTLLELTEYSNVKLLALLRVPTKSEFGLTRKAQPQPGQCPSDHFCLMADLELL